MRTFAIPIVIVKAEVITWLPGRRAVRHDAIMAVSFTLGETR